MTTGTNISFDYDNTLIRYKYVYDEDGNPIDAVYTEPHEENIETLQQLHDEGNDIFIVTARIEGLSLPEHDNSPKPEELIEMLDLPVRKIFYTSNRCKMDVLRDNGVTVHFDDCPEQCDRIMDEWAQNCSGPISVLVDAPDGINDFLKEKFSKLIGDRYERES